MSALLVISSLLQIGAAWQAIRLVKLTRRRTGWLLMATALALMAVRRLVSLAGAPGAGILDRGGLVPELVSVVISLLLLLGVAAIGAMFRKANEDAEAVRAMSLELSAKVAEQRRAELEIRRHREHLEEEVRKRTALLRESEETFRALAENSNDVVMRFDRRLRHLYASPIVESQTGIPAAEFVGRTHADLGFPEHLVAIWEAAIRRVFDTGSQNRIEFELPSGIWIDWMLIPEFTDGGEVRSVLTTARDITDRKHAEEALRRHGETLEELVNERTAELRQANELLQAEIVERRRIAEALRESEERVRSLYDNVAIGLYRTTPDGRVLMANPALVRMLGLVSFEELVSINLEEDSPYRDLKRSEFKSMIERDGRVLGLESTWLRTDGRSIIVRESAIAVRDERGAVTHYEGTVEDITGQRRLEEQLRQGQRLEAIGRLAGGVAHDFNNILMAVLGSAELMTRRLPEDESARRELAVIHQAVRRGSDLTHGLLAFARKQVLEPTDVDLNGAIAELMPMVSRVIPENIRIAFMPGESVGSIRVDRGNLDQVLLNLCVNARDAMPGGGTLSIATAAGSFEPQELGAVGGGGGAGGWAVLSVSDTGVGMDAETLAHIFEPFFTTKDPGQGTGMGLATVYGIVRQHGGSIRATSQPGRGSTFTIYLPVVGDAVVGAQAVGDAVAAGGCETILVAEDEEEVRRILVEILRSLGYRVIEAADGVEALAALQRENGAVDLVISDVVMPRMGGSELRAAALAIAPDARFLFSSGYAPDVLREDLKAPGVAYIAKPYSAAALGRKVREILDA